MANKWFYNQNFFDSEAEVNAAVVSLKSRLDNNPTDWVVVKEVTSNGQGGWTVNPTPLTDDQINNLDVEKHYNVTSVHHGHTATTLSSTDATNKVLEYRTLYAQWILANSITKTTDYAPTNVDMSGYI